MTISDRQVLSRASIAAKALAMTDSVGLAGLSMRKLGAELGVEAMSLYHYVNNKDDLLDAVLEQLYREISLPVELAADDWEGAIRHSLTAFHRVLITHRAALELFSMRAAPSLESFEVLYWAYQRFGEVGLDPVKATHAINFAVSFVIGFAASEDGAMAHARSDGGLNPDTIEDSAVAETLHQMRAIPTEEIFESGLETVICGLRQRYGLP